MLDRSAASGGTIVFRFGPFQLAEDAAELRRDGNVVPVQPKVLRLLAHLIRHRDHVVTKHELLDALWGEVAVVENALTTAVHAARSAVGDDAAHQHTIKTYPRRGYRFVAETVAATLPRVETPLPATHDSAPDAPAELLPFVGREGIMARLEEALGAVRVGRGRSVLLAGEAGVGKTRVAEALIGRAGELGLLAWSGWGYDGKGAPPYWPWLQILRTACEHFSAEEIAEIMPDSAVWIGTLVPEFAARLPAAVVPPQCQPDDARFHVFDAVARLLTHLSRSQPLVLLLEDLHDADHSSLRLLAFLAREIPQSPILVVGTYRDDEVPPGHPLTQTLAELSRNTSTRRERIPGLDREAVSRIVAHVLGADGTADLASAVHAATDGNAFYVREIVDWLVQRGAPAAGGELSVPPRVRDVLCERIDRLPELPRRLLEVAACVGREFDLAVPSHALGVAPLDAMRALAVARTARIVDEDSVRYGRYRFVHSLMRQVLYAELRPTERAVHHGRIAAAFETSARAGSEDHLGEIAHHFYEAREAGFHRDALRYCVRAGDRAAALHAHDEAAIHFERALEVLARAEGHAPSSQRCELLLALARAQSLAGHHVARGRARFLEAAEVARRIGSDSQLAMAALGAGGPIAEMGEVDGELIKLMDESLQRLDAGHPALRAQLEARMALELYAPSTFARGDALSAEAVALARGERDNRALGMALAARLAYLAPPSRRRERQRAAEELFALARSGAGDAAATWAHRWRLVGTLQSGDAAAFELAIDDYARQVEQQRLPESRWHLAAVRAMRALLDGRLGQGERLVFDALNLGSPHPSPTAVSVFTGQLAWLRRHQGRLSEVTPHLDEQAEAGLVHFAQGVSRASRAFVQAELGNLERAREAFDPLAVGGFADLPDDIALPLTLSLLAEACARLGDAKAAEPLYQRLLPYRHLAVESGIATLCMGSVGRPLGLLATTLERFAEAEQHFGAALRVNQRLRAGPFRAHTELDLGRLLLRRGAPGDERRGEKLVRSAVRAARQFGLDALLADVRASRPKRRRMLSLQARR